jgi:hypothetical protein
MYIIAKNLWSMFCRLNMSGRPRSRLNSSTPHHPSDCKTSTKRSNVQLVHRCTCTHLYSLYILYMCTHTLRCVHVYNAVMYVDNEAIFGGYLPRRRASVQS